MCLAYSENASDKLRRKLEQQKTMILFKVFCIEDNQLQTPFQHKRIASAGTLLSNRHVCAPNMDDSDGSDYYIQKDIINRGIHVFLTQEDAKKCVERVRTPYYHRLIILKVEVHVDDFVGAGTFDIMPPRLNAAVFMKVILPKEEFERAMEIGK